MHSTINNLKNYSCIYAVLEEFLEHSPAIYSSKTNLIYIYILDISRYTKPEYIMSVPKSKTMAH